MARPRCFVVGAIGDPGTPERRHADFVLIEIIQRVLPDSEFEVVRADRIAAPGLIDSQIITRLIEWELVIADLTWLNPNAMYEIGIRHMAQRPIVHMFEREQKLPFDLNHYRAVPFSISSPQDLEAGRKGLREACDAALDPTHIVENPVTQAAGRAKFDAEATPPMKVMQTQLDQMQRQIDELERSSIIKGVARFSDIHFIPGPEVSITEPKSLQAQILQLVPDAIVTIDGVGWVSMSPQRRLNPGRLSELRRLADQTGFVMATADSA